MTTRIARITIYIAALLLALPAHAEMPHSQLPRGVGPPAMYYGPARVPPGASAYASPAPTCEITRQCVYTGPPPAYAPLPPLPPVELPPPPLGAVPAPSAFGWVYGPYTVCSDPPACSNVFVSVGADGLNVRTVPNGPVIGSLANGVPIIPLQRDGNWVLIAPACVLVPTYTWSVTSGVPLSVCL